MHVSDILKTKGSSVVTVRPDLSIENLAQRLKLERIGAVIVSGSGRSVDGIISERDVVRALADHGERTLAMSVADLMTKGVVTCAPGDTISHVARLMTQRRVRHVPVMDDDRLVGIVSVGDVVKHRMDELELETSVLRDYAVARH